MAEEMQAQNNDGNVTKTLRRRKWLWAVLSVVIAACAGYTGFVGYLLFGDYIKEWLHRRPFDSVAWQDPKSINENMRIWMVDDLLRSHQFLGMTRKQVTDSIGEPDATPYFREWDMVYWLGPERGFMGIDSEWLVFRLDSQDAVTDYRIVRD